MLFGADQQMNWRFGGDVVEDDDIVILVEYLRWDGSFDDLAKDAGHRGNVVTGRVRVKETRDLSRKRFLIDEICRPDQ